MGHHRFQSELFHLSPNHSLSLRPQPATNPPLYTQRNISNPQISPGHCSTRSSPHSWSKPPSSPQPHVNLSINQLAHATVLLHPYQTYLKFQPYMPLSLRAASWLPLCLQDTTRLLQAATPCMHALSGLTSPSSEPPQTCTSPQPPYTPT